MNMTTKIMLILAGIALAYISMQAQAADIEVQRYKQGGYFVSVTGELEMDDDQRLAAILQANQHARNVHLYSPGGLVNVGWRMAKVIRENERNTVSFRKCVSACTYAFMGGVKRFMSNKNRSLGYHPAYSPSWNGSASLNDVYREGQADALRTMKGYAAYVAAGKEWEVITHMSRFYNQSRSGEMFYPNHDDLIEAGIVTEVF